MGMVGKLRILIRASLRVQAQVEFEESFGDKDAPECTTKKVAIDYRLDVGKLAELAPEDKAKLTIPL